MLPDSSRTFIIHALEKVQDLDGNRSIYEYLADITKIDDTTTITIRTPYPCQTQQGAWTNEINQELAGHNLQVHVDYQLKVPQHITQQSTTPHDRVKNIIAIASGKGGVGKSTTCIHLALALQAQGARVGILDADVYGPSIPTMLGITGNTHSTADNKIIPFNAFGIEAMSIGCLVKNTDAMVWRGPIATNTLKQLFAETAWGELDYLFIDLPPGTGDIPLTLVQSIPLVGAAIVTTPQDIALLDVRRGIEMFRKVDVTPLGIIENMSTHTCPNCGHQSHVFGKQGGTDIANEYELPVLGKMPLTPDICTSMDSGQPIIATHPESEISQLYQSTASRLAARLSQKPLYFEKKAKQLGRSLLNLKAKKSS